MGGARFEWLQLENVTACLGTHNDVTQGWIVNDTVPCGTVLEAILYKVALIYHISTRQSAAFFLARCDGSFPIREAGSIFYRAGQSNGEGGEHPCE